MSESLSAAAPQWGATIAHAADYYRRYPGETVTLFTRVSVQQPLSEFTVRISVPEGLVPGESQASANHDGSLPHLVFVDEQRYFTWTVKREVQPGERFEYQLEATIAPHLRPAELSSRAVLVLADRSGNGTPPNFPTETVTLAVSPQGRLLTYLPAIYTEQDELMGRFLMLFESFWEPLEDRIDHIDYYFDSKLAPPDLLPWLASWIDLVLDEQWPEEKRRRAYSRLA